MGILLRLFTLPLIGMTMMLYDSLDGDIFVVILKGNDRPVAKFVTALLAVQWATALCVMYRIEQQANPYDHY